MAIEQSSAKLYTVNDVFEGSVFSIPDYQRGYAWGMHQLTAFWNDLINLNEGTGVHYLGMLALKQDSNGCYQVIDGQQRLTTVVVLLSAIYGFIVSAAKENAGWKTEAEGLRNKFLVRPSAGKLQPVISYADEDGLQRCFIREVLHEEVGECSYCETSYTRNLRTAYAFFRGKVSEIFALMGKAGVSELAEKCTGRMQFNVFLCPADFDVNVTFETMNNRGKKLTNLELLKNRLLYLSSFYQPSKAKELQKRINEAWRVIYAQLGRSPSMTLSDDGFLKAHKNIYFGYSRRRGDDFARFLLDTWFVTSRINAQNAEAASGEECSNFDEDEDEEQPKLDEQLSRRAQRSLLAEEIAEYVDDLARFSRSWYATFHPDDPQVGFSNELQESVSKLMRVHPGYFCPIIAAVLDVMGRKLADVSDVIEIFTRMERFIFVCFRLGKERTSFRSSQFFGLTKDVYSGKCKIDRLVESEYWKCDDQRELQEFVLKIREYFRSGVGYYGWKEGILHFLYEYEMSMAANREEKSTLHWDSFAEHSEEQLTVEHIYPQMAADAYWINLYQQFDAKERRAFGGALGNLLPLSRKINAMLQNGTFSQKVEERYRGGCFSEQEVSEVRLKEKAEWTPNRIYERSVKLVDFLISHWHLQVNLGQDEMRQLLNELVGLDFMNAKERPQMRELAKDEIERMVRENAELAGRKGVARKQKSAIGTPEKKFLRKSAPSGKNVQESLRMKFWDSLFDVYPFSKTIYRKQNQKRTWISYTLPIKGVLLTFVFDQHQAKIECNIDNRADGVYGRLEDQKQKIESAVTKRLNWDPQTKRGKENRSRVSMSLDGRSIFNEEDCKRVREWFCAYMPVFEGAICEALNNRGR